MGTSVVAEKVRLAGEVVGPKVREVRDVVGPKAREIGEAVGPKVKELGETVAPKIKTARRKVGFWIAGEEPRKPRRWPTVAGVGIGAAVAFFLDPVSGKRRRAATKEWVVGRFRTVTQRASGVSRGDAYASGYQETQGEDGDATVSGATEDFVRRDGVTAPTR